MKRNLIIAAVLAAFAGVAVASNTQYNNEAGEQDLHAPIAFSDQYRNDAGEQDLNSPIASSDEYRNNAGEQDEHVSIADAGDKGVEEQNSLQLG